MKLVLYEPEIPQNTGTMMRLCACLNIQLHIIGPCGFVWNDRKLARAGMDYRTRSHVIHHTSWSAFLTQNTARLVLLTPYGKSSYTDFQFDADDALLLGKESTGVPPQVFDQIPNQVYIPMEKDNRSLNVSLAAAMVTGEALRQTNLFPTA